MTSGRATIEQKNQLIEWLRMACGNYKIGLIGILQQSSFEDWPINASNFDQLLEKLESGGFLTSLPKEPAALANIVEVSLVNFLIRKLKQVPGVQPQRGTERGYPDLEISGPAFGGIPHAIDVKVARRKKNLKDTQSRITLYTGNTYFKYPTLHWPSTLRPFAEYGSHLDILAIYTLNEDSNSRVDDLEIIIQEPWKIASKQRSSTTREYIGAVTSIAKLRSGQGEFANEDAFYKFWRAQDFKVGKAVSNVLAKLLGDQSETRKG